MHSSDPTLREVIASLEHLEQLLQREQASQQPPPQRGEGQLDKGAELKPWSRTAAVHQWAVDLRTRIETVARESGDQRTPAPSATLADVSNSQDAPSDIPGNDRPGVQFENRGPIAVLMDEEVGLGHRVSRSRPHLWSGAGMVLLIGLCFAWFSLGRPPRVSSVPLEVSSTPLAAKVFLDDALMGQTPLRLGSVQARSYRLRVEKDGYAPFFREVNVKQGQPANLNARLIPLTLQQLQTQAESLFEQGNLMEADHFSTLLLQRSPDDERALNLKERILIRYLEDDSREARSSKETQLASPAQQASKSSTPVDAASKATSISVREGLAEPGKPEIPKPHAHSRGVTKPLTTAASKVSSGNDRSMERHTPTTAWQAKKVEPASNPALTLAALPLRTSNTPVPLASSGTSPDVVLRFADDLAAQQQPQPANPELVAQVKARISAKDFTGAQALLAQLPGNSRAAADLSRLLTTAQAELQQQQALRSIVQKAESALIVGHYITPLADNVLVHCNDGLKIDPQNSKLLTLKKEVVTRSVAQAKDWIQRGKFDSARLLYSALNYLSQGDSGFPLSRHEIQQELNRLEFTAYPVIHDHRFGSCTGRLRMNAYALSFVPSGDTVDGLTVPLKQVSVAEIGEALTVRLNGATYRFRPNSSQETAGGEALRTLYERLMSLIAKGT